MQWMCKSQHQTQSPAAAIYFGICHTLIPPAQSWLSGVPVHIGMSPPPLLSTPQHLSHWQTALQPQHITQQTCQSLQTQTTITSSCNSHCTNRDCCCFPSAAVRTMMRPHARAHNCYTTWLVQQQLQVDDYSDGDREKPPQH